MTKTAPSATSDRQGRRRIAWGFLGMVVLVWAVEVGLERHRDAWISLTSACFEWAYRSAVLDAKTADVVCLGDSVLKFGFAPRVFERVTGRKADNWATTGNPPAVALSLLRAHLRAGGKPRAILVDFKPFLLEQGVRPELDAWSRVASFGDALELAWEAKDPDLALEFSIARAFASCRDRSVIRTWFRAAIAGRTEPTFGPTSDAIAAQKRNWRINRGGQLLPPNPLAATQAEFSNEKANLNTGWKCQPANTAIIARFFELADKHSIPVYWVLTPIHPRLQGGRDRLGIDAAFTRFVQAQRDRAPGRVTVVDARRLGLSPERFIDATHLDARGASVLTTALARWFLNPPSTDQWVQLEPIAPGDAALWASSDDGEDTDASSLAVRLEALEASRRR